MVTSTVKTPFQLQMKWKTNLNAAGRVNCRYSSLAIDISVDPYATI